MVDLPGLSKNLNHIYNKVLPCPGLVIGLTFNSDTFELELFERSLALTSDLKKLPILVGIHCFPNIFSAIAQKKTSSGITGLATMLLIFNGDIDVDLEDSVFTRDADFIDQLNESGNLIWTGYWKGEQGGSPVSHILETVNKPAWDYEGAILLTHELNFLVITAADAAVSSVDLPATLMSWHCMFEVDWMPVSKPKMTEYIVENVYARGD